MPLSDSYREAIRKTLAQYAGESPDAPAVAAAALRMWQSVAASLEPVIGVMGVDALFIRSLHLLSAEFPWLTAAETQSAALHVKTQLAQKEPATAMAAAQALLLTFSKLLSSLIGDSLTEHLLAPVWAAQLPKKEAVS